MVLLVQSVRLFANGIHIFAPNILLLLLSLSLPLLFPTQSNLYYRSTDQVVKPYLQAHLGREEELEKVLFKHSDSDEEETKID